MVSPRLHVSEIKPQRLLLLKQLLLGLELGQGSFSDQIGSPVMDLRSRVCEIVEALGVVHGRRSSGEPAGGKKVAGERCLSKLEREIINAF